MADTRVLGTREVTRTGSSPVPRTMTDDEAIEGMDRILATAQRHEEIKLYGRVVNWDKEVADLEQQVLQEVQRQRALGVDEDLGPIKAVFQVTGSYAKIFLKLTERLKPEVRAQMLVRYR